MEKKIIINCEEDTRKFGLDLADDILPGQVIALIGDLGTGKTALTRYIAEGLGIRERVSSPTFTIVKEYRSGRLPMFHFDIYRVHDIDELYEIGIEEYFFGDGVSIVEWADLAPGILPKDAIVIRIQYGENEGQRIYSVSNLSD